MFPWRLRLTMSTGAYSLDCVVVVWLIALQWHQPL
jgi:hypothetical protein